MSTRQVHVSSRATYRLPGPILVVVATIAGIGWGVVARVWMRFIADDPEFTWSGTIFIVGAFGIFGATQSVAYVARRARWRRSRRVVARTIGSGGLLPLFVGAGAIMAPTVMGGTLALARPSWPRVVRVLLAVVAAGPVAAVLAGLVGDFGWSIHTAVGWIWMSLIYGAIIAAARPTLGPWYAPRALPRWARVGAITVGSAGVALVAVALVGIR